MPEDANITGMPANSYKVSHLTSVSGCRSQIEANITGVARGQRTKQEVLEEAAHAFSGFFQAARQQSGVARIQNQGVRSSSMVSRISAF